MKRKLENELRREVDSMLPENMVNEIKQREVMPEKINNNISVIHEKPKHSIIPIIASCVASVVICLAVFLPMAIQNNRDYNSWLANQNQQQVQEIEDDNTENN